MIRRFVLIISMVLLMAESAMAQGNAAKSPYTKKVAVVVYEGVEILDFAGPSEVFVAAGSFASNKGEQAFKVYTVAQSKEPIISQRFLKVLPEFTIENAPQPDIIVIPGGGSHVLTQDPKFMAWARKTMDQASTVLTVCTGAFVPAQEGLFDGLDVTTYYGAIQGLREQTPKARVHEGRRFIDNGKFVTTAGVSAGIDGALHVVARELGRVVADQTAQYMEYRWTPETYLASSYPLLNPRIDDRGRTVQQANLLRTARNWPAAAEAYKKLISEDPQDHRLWMQLGNIFVSMKQLDEAAEAFGRAAESPELRAQALYNQACAYALRKENGQAIESLRNAIAAGYKDKQQLLADTDLESLKGDPRFKELVNKL